jgi:16S rRNA (cytosine1402-N4)-methyltransferase
VVVDCTLGLGGHSDALLSGFPEARLIALDRDPEALKLAGERLSHHGDRATLVHAVYDELPAVLTRLGVPRVAAVLFDLGVSSMQLDEAGRGFAYAQDAPLDMRMDPTTGPSAADVINTYAPGELVRVLRVYGEERFARKIVEAVVAERAREPITTSSRLVALIRDALPQAAKRTGGNPAKRTFQALRIEVNGELAALERALPAAITALAVGGRIAVLSYHSLEDRLVKRALAEAAASTAPPGLPVIPEHHQPRLRLLTRGAERPSEAEIADNTRAAPARLRAAERIREAA